MNMPRPLPDETTRLALLRALDLLDSEPEEVFDALTRLTARLLDVPIALVSLVDEHRQWFKSRHGLDTRETPRAVSLCAHAIHGDEPFVIPDTLADARFADNPLVTGEPGIRFYAGIPLRTRDGHALGTLCAIDRVPRRLDAGQLLALQDLATVARREVLNREAAFSARALAQENLRVVSESEALYHATFDRAAVGIAIVGLDGRWIRFNPELCRITGRTFQQLDGLTFQDITYPPDVEMSLRSMHRLLAGEVEHYELEKRYVRPDGQLVWGHVTVTLQRRDGRPDHFVTVVADVTARRAAEDSLNELRLQLEQRVRGRTLELQLVNESLRQTMHEREAAQQALQRSEALLRAVLENALDAFVSVDADGVVHEWNRQAERIFGWRRDEAVGRPMNDLIVPPEHQPMHRRGMDGQGSRVLNQRIELPAMRRDGSRFTCEIAVTALPTAPGEKRRFAAFMHDISHRKEAERLLADAATTDELTGLPNRRCFEAQAAGALARARREQHGVAVLFLDLDRFKSINDRYGHGIGDAVLKAFAARLRAALRESDIVARLAGDEFVVMVEGVDPRQTAPVEEIARKILVTVAETLALPAATIPMRTSIGVAIGDGTGTLDRLLHDADQALYRAKRQGRNTVCLAPSRLAA